VIPEAADSPGWEALTPSALRAQLVGLTMPWWVTGGWAIDLFLGHETRHHGHIDVAVLRSDQAALASRLAGWTFQYVAPDRTLVPWHGEVLATKTYAIWARRSSNDEAPWTCKFLLHEATRWEWVYRHHDAVRRPITDLGSERVGVPYLRPEIVLLLKSTNLSATNEADFEAALPDLDRSARRWLARSLDVSRPQHPWRPRLDPLRPTG
jgi:hypothetical protein